MSQSEGGPPEFNIRPKAAGAAGTTSYARRKRHRSPMTMLAPALVIAVLVVGGLVALVLLKPSSRPPVEIALDPILDKRVVEHETLVVDAVATVTDGEGNVVYWLMEAPEGASIEAGTGRFTWQPTESQGPGEYAVVVGATLDTAKEAQGKSRFVVSVVEDPQPPVFEEVADQRTKPGQSVAFEVVAKDPDTPAASVRYRLGPGAPVGAKIDPDTGRFEWTPDDSSGGKTHEIVVEAVEGDDAGRTANVTLRVAVSAPPKPQTAPMPGLVEEKPAAEPVEVAESPDEHGNETILEWFNKRKLFHPAAYKALRKVFAERFVMAHEDEIQTAWGEDDEALTAWLDKHIDIKEEFYTAIDPEVDDVPAALALFHEMWKLSPLRLAEYGNLAIAVAVTWDQEKGAYSYKGKQLRTRSLMPEDLVGAIDNYKYVVQSEQVMQGRGRFLPWEFLVHVVNHKTPLAERQWALQRFLPERSMIGRCYSKVPYDHEMLETEGAVTKLDGKPYTLPNLLVFGGVCTMQADFASRVGKCLGVPTAAVSGPNRYGGAHAWVMWSELNSVTQKGIGYSLESHGRYRGDHYYVGHLVDPKTAEKITDRQLELRLHTVGLNPIAKRQSDMIMAVYPMLKEHHEMGVEDQLAFLGQLIRLCPGNEAAWHSVAAISREGLVPKTHTKMMMGIVAGMFATFATLPDFTWEVFDDLIAFEERPKNRTLLYSQLTALYEQGKRPDLSCKAHLKFADYLVEKEQPKDAILGLAAAIMRFPDEGSFVPLMLDRMEELCGEFEGTEKDVMNFYGRFLPQIPTKRGSSPSQYCVAMYERAIALFRKYDQEPFAQQIEMQLAALKAVKASSRN
jgi:putative Ig domain-containing protein